MDWCIQYGPGSSNNDGTRTYGIFQMESTDDHSVAADFYDNAFCGSTNAPVGGGGNEGGGGIGQPSNADIGTTTDTEDEHRTLYGQVFSTDLDVDSCAFRPSYFLAGKSN
jgi:hypothetical protein